MSYGLNSLNKGRQTQKKINFPIRVHGYDLTKEGAHAVIGVNLATSEKVRVVIGQRDNSGERKRAEIIHFALDAAEEARKRGDIEGSRVLAEDPLSKALTAVGGMLMVEDSYYDKSREMVIAGGLRSLSHTVNESIVEASVLACINPLYANGDTLRGSVDIVYPERGEVATDLSHMHDLVRDMLIRGTKGTPLCVVNLIDHSTNETGAKLLIPRVSTDSETFSLEDPDDSIDSFWQSLGDLAQADDIMRGINGGDIRVRIIPGVRYWFLRKWLEEHAKTPEKHGARYRLKDGDMEEGDRIHGFLPSTLALRQHSNAEKYFPGHVIPLVPFGRPVPLHRL